MSVQLIIFIRVFPKLELLAIFNDTFTSRIQVELAVYGIVNPNLVAHYI